MITSARGLPAPPQWMAMACVADTGTQALLATVRPEPDQLTAEVPGSGAPAGKRATKPLFTVLVIVTFRRAADAPTGMWGRRSSTRVCPDVSAPLSGPASRVSSVRTWGLTGKNGNGPA